MAKSRDEVWDKWKNLVNMTPKELEDWLETDESRSVGDSDEGESTGHKSGRRIVELRRTKKAELSDKDWDWMGKVVGYIARRSAQVPSAGVEHSHWRYSLMNWGPQPN